MDTSDVKKAIIVSFVTIFIGILVYSLIGILSITGNTVIYDGTPTEFVCYPNNEEWGLTLTIKNNAPITLPYLNPIYLLRATVEGNNNTYVHFMGTGNVQRNFTDYYMDIEKIDVGDEKTVVIDLHVAEGNFSLTVDVHLQFLDLKAASVTYLVEYEGDYAYTISRLR